MIEYKWNNYGECLIETDNYNLWLETDWTGDYEVWVIYPNDRQGKVESGLMHDRDQAQAKAIEVAELFIKTHV